MWASVQEAAGAGVQCAVSSADFQDMGTGWNVKAQPVPVAEVQQAEEEVQQAQAAEQRVQAVG